MIQRRTRTVSRTAINFAVLCSVVFFVTVLPRIEAAAANGRCRSDQFRCSDGRECVGQADRCDGTSDCDDGSDETGCDTPISDNFLLVSVVRDSESSTHIRPQINQVDLSNGNAKPLLTNERSKPTSMAVDVRRRTLYYVEKNSGTIVSLSLDHPGNSSRVIYRKPGPSVDLDGLALDSSAQRLYFCDAGRDPRVAEISIAAGSGESPRTVHSGRNLKPKSVVVDEANKELYWTDWGSAPGIFVIGIEPGAQKRALIVHDIVVPNAIAIDFKEGLVYWVDAHLDRVEVANLNGQQRMELWRHSDRQETHHYAMTISPEYLYICDWTSGYVKKLHRRTRIISDQMPSISGKKAGIVYYNSSYNNTGTCRPDRIDVLNRTSAMTSESTTLPVTTVPDDRKSTSSNDTIKPEKLDSIDGSQAQPIAVAVVCSLLAFGVLLSLVAWYGIRKRKRASVSNHLQLSNSRQPVRSSPSDSRTEDSYVRLPEPATDPYLIPIMESGDDYYTTLNEYTEAPENGSQYDGYYAVKENNEQELAYDDVA